MRAALLVAALPLVVIGLAARTAQTQDASARPDTIRVDGSNGVIPLATALADGFRRAHPRTVVLMGDGMGSGARIAALRERRIDIALASHGLDTAALRQQGLAPFKVATTAVVIGVNAAVPATAITSGQWCAILTGVRSRWGSVTGSDEPMPMTVVVREETEVDMEVVRRHVACLGSTPVSAHARVAADTDAMRRALLDDAGAVGVTTATVVQQSEGRLRALTLDGVAPTTDAVAGGHYRMVRDSYFVTSEVPAPAVARFLAWLGSPAADSIVAANGAVSARQPAGR